LALLKKSGGEELTLSQARDVAAIYRLKVKAGIDPLEEREIEAVEKAAAAQAAKAKAVRFKSVAETYIAANEASWRNDKHRQQWRNTLSTYVYPVIGDLPVGDVATGHVLEIIEPLWKSKPETASRVRGRIETVLDAAKARGYRSYCANPACTVTADTWAPQSNALRRHPGVLDPSSCKASGGCLST
jgi:integrase